MYDQHKQEQQQKEQIRRQKAQEQSGRRAMMGAAEAAAKTKTNPRYVVATANEKMQENAPNRETSTKLP